MITTLYRLFAGFEHCFYIDTTGPLTPEEFGMVLWVIAETFEPKNTFTTSFLTKTPVVEIGPRLSVETPFSSNAVSICHRMGIANVRRIEFSCRYPIIGSASHEEIISKHLDQMTQIIYPATLGNEAFAVTEKPRAVRVIPILERGEDALRELNLELGLGMDAWDITYYTDLFRRMGRNPTDVECFQIGNANSEHCRHWFFRGKIKIDGVEMSESLLDIIRAPLRARGNTTNTILAFNDNVGAIKGSEVLALMPEHPGQPSRFVLKEGLWHITATAETHNHPTMIAPFPGAETGAGGRIRDNAAGGQGSLPLVGLAGYAVGNLFIPGHQIPGEVIGGEKTLPFASPLRILIEGSNGVTAYGNQFGEAAIGGFTRTFGLMVGDERREWLKPILYSGGIGRIRAIHAVKSKPEKDMLIIRIGGPAFRIGVGGGAASSMAGGSNTQQLDFNSVQRGNAEMENRANRVIRACIEMGLQNPIKSIHDQGAGGPSNVLTELMEPVGGRVDIRQINVGDQTMSVLELWSAEFQEGYGFLVNPAGLERFQTVCARERVNCEVMGLITGDGKVTVIDSSDGTEPVSLKLEDILGSLPQKTFTFERAQRVLRPLVLPEGLTLSMALEKVFLLPQVGSKGFLVRKGDRSVTGLVRQQQCCGPAQIPVANVSVSADSYLGITGAASAIGEQPIKALVNPAAGARMSVGEMLTNIVSAKIGGLGSVSCRVNWMSPAKLPHEGPLLYDAAKALSDLMVTLGIAADGGKDSLSMAAKVDGKVVKAPGQVVVLGYAPVPDVSKIVTPDFKGGLESIIGFIDLGEGKNRMGGSSLAKAFGQVGNDSPDVDDAEFLKNTFNAVQELVNEGIILSLHDRSDGGLLTTIAEMCMAGNLGAEIHLDAGMDAIPAFFNEELGIVFEYRRGSEQRVCEVMQHHWVPFVTIGHVNKSKHLTIRQGSRNGGHIIFEHSLAELRQWWEATSSALEELQANPATVRMESHSFSWPQDRNYSLTFTPESTPTRFLFSTFRPKVAVLREEGTNGDREMAAAFLAAGLEPWDVNMEDLLTGRVTLDQFRGLIFPGGFSYKDTFDSAKGWAAVIRFNPKLREMFDRFYDRPDTFSLGVCNGCQLIALLGWVPFRGLSETSQPRFVHNDSGRFESRWTQVRIERSQAVLLRGMQDSTFGVWVAHGEGKLVFPDPGVLTEVQSKLLVPLTYVDSKGCPTDFYPDNPNGSSFGYAGLCSPDGRHLAMMPHPERCFLKWQWPWMPEDWKKTLEASPWLCMFQNARKWCDENQVR